MAAAAVLDFLNFRILTAKMIKRVKMRLRAKVRDVEFFLSFSFFNPGQTQHTRTDAQTNEQTNR